VILIVASRHDTAARVMAQKFEHAAVITAADLSEPGWRFESGHASASVAMVGNQPISAHAITCVINRLPWISPSELVHIVIEDRAYVAAEMSAFLIAWLTELPCPVYNRPSAMCISGPGWQPAQWIYAAAAAGLKTKCVEMPSVLDDGVATDFSTRVVAVLNGVNLNGPHELSSGLLKLAQLAKVNVFTAHFVERGNDLFFHSVNEMPDVTQKDLFEHFEKTCVSGAAAQ
jgi:hypothetical protein